MGAINNIGRQLYQSPIIMPVAYDFTSRDATQPNFWIEEIGNHAPGGYETSKKYAHATLYAYIPDDAIAYYNFENTVLGYHYTDSSCRLRRVNPISHPKKPNLFATKISEAKGLAYRGRTGLVDPATGSGSVGAGGGAFTISTGPTSYAKYARQLVCVEFAPIKYPMLLDATIDSGGSSRNESARYVDYDTKTNVYDVSIQVGNYYFAEGPPSRVAQLDGTTKAATFQGEVNFLEVKTTFSLKWRMVPDDYIFDTVNYQYGYPTKLNSCVGKVNSLPFAGFPAGTLLTLEPETERNVDGTLRRADTLLRPYFTTDVMIPMIHFDPPHIGDDQGHNLKPWPNPNDPSMTYYLVTTAPNGDKTKQRIYGQEDYSKMFQHWST